MADEEQIPKQELKILYEKYLANDISESEFNRFNSFLLQPENKAYFRELMIQDWHITDPIPGFEANEIELPKLEKTNIRELSGWSSLGWLKVAAAVVGLLLISTVLYYLLQPSDTEINENQEMITGTIQNDLLPGGNKAILTLSDGTMIILDSADNGSLAMQGNTNVMKLDDGQLAYDINSYEPDAGKTLYNTISTPRGGQYKIILPDGSKVWLNAASSLKFPAAFTGNERMVELTGEGYFEVAKDEAKPFKVTTNGVVVEALGTQFNVNVYEDETKKSTTLVEGKVQVSNENDIVVLTPGEQAEVDDEGKIKTIMGVDVAEISAWKNGLFLFDNVDIETIMRQVSRWYDVDIKYEGKVPVKFSATIERNVPVSKLLRLLQLTSRVKFKVEKNEITVSP